MLIICSKEHFLNEYCLNSIFIYLHVFKIYNKKVVHKRLTIHLYIGYVLISAFWFPVKGNTCIY